MLCMMLQSVRVAVLLTRCLVIHTIAFGYLLALYAMPNPITGTEGDLQYA
jgi:hypothetical protein